MPHCGLSLESSLDGRAIRERHYTNHGYPKHHSDIHDADVIWNGKNGGPRLVNQVNYFDVEVPVFKSFNEVNIMRTYVGTNTPEQNRFKTIEEFRICMEANGEVEFTWNGKHYGISHIPNSIIIYDVNIEETTDFYKTADEVLTHMIDGDRLRDIITKVEVLSRFI